MLITYKGNENNKKKVGFADDNLINDKSALLTEIGKSNARLKEIKFQYDKEKAVNEKLLAMRYELYKREKAEELKLGNHGSLPNKKEQIELYFSQGKSYEEIALLTEASYAYIYKVVSNYRKKNDIRIDNDNPERSETEEIIIMYSRANKSINEIATNAKVSRQYVYKVLKKYNIPYPTRKRK